MSDQSYDPSDGTLRSVSGDDRSGSGVRSRLATASMGTTAGKGLGSMGSGSDAPKQNAGESMSDFGERLRVYRQKRRDQTDAAAQKSALRSLK